MTSSSAAAVALVEDRFERFRRIPWWDQQRLAAARVLVVGAGGAGQRGD